MTAPQSQLEIAAAARQVQNSVRAQLMRDVTRLWPLLDRKRLDETWPAWLRAMQLLVGSYHGQSAQAAGRFYRQARAAATQSPAPAALVKLAPAPSPEWTAKAFGFSGPGMLSRDVARPNTALTTTLGTAARIAADGGRVTVMNTTHSDPVAVGWFRVTDGKPCAFCALLAARPVIGGKGSLYRSEQSAGFQAHNHCGCTAAPMFDRNMELPDVNRQAAEVYRNRGNGPALKAFTAAWADHTAA